MSTKSALNQEISAFSNIESANKYLYLLAGVHGNEPEGVYVLEQLYSWLQTQSFNIPILVIPVFNPDGYNLKTRVNANKVDLNRNYPTKDWSQHYQLPKYNPGLKPASEPETVFLLELFEQYTPGMIISFHSWKPMLNINAKARDLATYIAQFNNYIVTEDIGYPTPGSLGTYVDEFLNCGILTFECPEVSAEITLEEIWGQSETGLKKMFHCDAIIG